MPAGRVWCLMQVASCLIAMSATTPEKEMNFRRAPTKGLPSAIPVAILDKMRSSLDCARKCNASVLPACCSYGYSRESSQCLLYSLSHQNTSLEDGFTYFVGCPVTVTPQATVPPDVTEPTACSSNGYTYDEDDDKRIYGYDLLFSLGMSQTSCRNWCSANTLCRSLDWKDWSCLLKYRSKHEVPNYFRSDRNWIHFEKRCS